MTDTEIVCFKCEGHFEGEKRCLKCGWLVCPLCGACLCKLTEGEQRVAKAMYATYGGGRHHPHPPRPMGPPCSERPRRMKT